jgi:uncharacterized protein
MPWIRIVVTGIALVTCLVVLTIATGILIDWAWFSDLGYSDVFRTTVATKASVFLVVFTATAAVLWANARLAVRLGGPANLGRSLIIVRDASPFQALSGLDVQPQHVRLALMIGICGLGLLVGLFEMSQWDLVLKFLFQVPYEQSDPVFGRDIGFYLFSLPVYVALKNWALTTIILSALVAGAVYWVLGKVQLGSGNFKSEAVLGHASVLLGALLAVKAWSYALDRYLLLYSDNGVVVGASYTDLHVTLPILQVLIVLALGAAVLSWVNIRVRSHSLPLAAVVLVFGGSLVLGEGLPAVVQRLIVRPNELELERPYIQSSITATRQAYDLHNLTVKPFSVEQSLTRQALDANQPTVDNISLWGSEPLIDTYRQLQEIRTYYRFTHIDEDRYWLDGAYRQVMLSVRELDPTRLPAHAQTWVNRHILFTHGTGLVMSPVTRKSVEGLPHFYLQNIPPVATGGPAIRQPRIYFGELKSPFVIVNGSTPEFDFPKGKDNIFAYYQGARGVSAGGAARRALFAWYFQDPNILLSDYITAESRILFRRTVQERVATIAPFLRLDRDPYPVVSDGRIVWIQDAYTTSSYFPYAQSAPQGEFNYIRNAVKAVVDAHDGSVDFYLAAPSDPIARTYGRVFPDLFKPLSRMPADLQRHIRYPQDLFSAQVQIYRTYHMDTPEVFYNREDLWQFPRQPNETAGQMAPYYMVMRLPGEPQAEFILMVPMTPSQRDNMIAWVAARCDPPHYGELIVYEFPKDKLVFGPFQIEARISQDTAISQQLTLWNQLGSRVIRGKLHAIPIEDSILYVLPLYLRAETGHIPELKRVIAAYGDRVVMEETLADALGVLFRSPSGSLLPGAMSGRSRADRAREALLGHYTRAMERLKAGDWGGFGAELEAMRALLEEKHE